MTDEINADTLDAEIAWLEGRLYHLRMEKSWRELQVPCAHCGHAKFDHYCFIGYCRVDPQPMMVPTDGCRQFVTA